mmetsp:Transcript_19040/g.45728  ORF Transcript_19040/g.45728 Transcript_19040/m.45728 type:complete len:167 (-) Transcript_19040:1496-1996(-)
MGEDKEQIAIAQTSDKKSDGESGTMRRHGNDSTEKTAMLNTTSPSNLEARLASAIVNNTLSPESEEKAEVEPLSYDGRGFEETKEAVCSRSSSFGDDGSFSKLRHSPNSHQVDFKELRPDCCLPHCVNNRAFMRAILFPLPRGRPRSGFILGITTTTTKSFLMMTS